MKKINLLSAVIVLLGIILPAMLCSSCSSKNESAEKKSAVSGNEVISAIATRASVRSFQNKEISKDTVEILLRAAMAAPTAINKQPWAFVVIDNRETLNAIADSMRSMKMAAQAPLAVVVCGDMSKAPEGDAQAYWVQDASAATENMLIAAHSIGLGAVWCGVYPIPERVAYFRDLLDLPDNIIPLCCVPIGYPTENPEVKDKWKPENIHYNSWQPKASN